MSSIAEQINESTELAAVDIRATELTDFGPTTPVMYTPAIVNSGTADVSIGITPAMAAGQ